MRSIINYLKYFFGKANDQTSYLQMRHDYIYSRRKAIDIVCRINSFLNPKYNIKRSSGILGDLDGLEVINISDRIKRDGFYIFQKCAPLQVVEELRSFAQRTPLNYLTLHVDGTVAYSKDIIAYQDAKELSNRYQFLNISIFNNKSILQLITDANFLHIANQYLSAKPILDIVTMWWSTGLSNIVPEKREILKNASAQMFHFDMDRLKFLKFFIYLTDVNTNTGPHVFVKASHNRVPSYVKRDGRYSDELVNQYDKDNIVEINGKAGTIIAVDTRGLHKGKELVEGDRLIFQVEFTNSLFGNPSMPQVLEKFKYTGEDRYFSAYKWFFKK